MSVRLVTDEPGPNDHYRPVIRDLLDRLDDLTAQWEAMMPDDPRPPATILPFRSRT